MRSIFKHLAGPFCAVYLLTGCGSFSFTRATPEPAFRPSLSPPRTDVENYTGPWSGAGYDVPGEEGRGMVAGPITTDGLEGRYYNDYLRSTLTLDGAGSFRLTGEGNAREGSYIYSDGALMLDLGENRLAGVVDGDGDITLEDRRGYYFHDFAFWGITEMEAGAVQAEDFPVGLIDNGDGTCRYRDADNAVAVSFPSGMTVLSNTLAGAVTVSDGQGGYVSGRNVTVLHSTTLGTDDEFMEDYFRSFVMGDYATLYGETESYESLRLLHDGTGGSLAAAELWINGKTTRTLVRMVLYTSTYADGTVNLICKTIYAPSEERAASLEEAVTNMGAVRLAK